MNFRYYAKYNPKQQTKLNYKMSKSTLGLKNGWDHTCPCGWMGSNKQNKTLERIVRLHNTRCEKGAEAYARWGKGTQKLYQITVTENAGRKAKAQVTKLTVS